MRVACMVAPRAGAGMIFSQGLMRMRGYDQIEQAVRDMNWAHQGAGGQPNPSPGHTHSTVPGQGLTLFTRCLTIVFTNQYSLYRLCIISLSVHSLFTPFTVSLSVYRHYRAFDCPLTVCLLTSRTLKRGLLTAWLQ